jgi:hypothetical protein
MDDLYEIIHEMLRALGRIEDEMVQIRKLSERVALLEQWQYWLKGAWALLAAGLALLLRRING